MNGASDTAPVSDEVQIAEAIKNAEVLADAGDREAALRIITDALEVFPDSKALQNKKEEYSKPSSPVSAQAASASPAANASGTSPFYGIWFSASKSYDEAESAARDLRSKGFDAQVVVTTDWSGLNTEKWYVTTAGSFATKGAAEDRLAQVRAYYPDAYIKYSGEYTGGAVTSARPDQMPEENAPFYGIWCGASKDIEEAWDIATTLRNEGFNAQVFDTADWSNLNSEHWYVVSAGVYSTSGAAERELSNVRAVCPDAYIKYSGEWQGQ